MLSSPALASAALFALPLPSFAQSATTSDAATQAGGELPTVDVVATTPLGGDTSVLNVPSETQVLTGEQIDNLNQLTLQDAFARSTPGVSVTDSQGSPFSESLDFRGETATPVPGTPEGLAVYMNGVRINESYGDVVNWDLIPSVAIDQAQIVTGNPVFGLNALAGAVVINTKNGFYPIMAARSTCRAAPTLRPRARRNTACRRATGPITSRSRARAPMAIAISASRMPRAPMATSAIGRKATKSI